MMLGICFEHFKITIFATLLITGISSISDANALVLSYSGQIKNFIDSDDAGTFVTFITPKLLEYRPPQSWPTDWKLGNGENTSPLLLALIDKNALNIACKLLEEHDCKLFFKQTGHNNTIFKDSGTILHYLLNHIRTKSTIAHTLKEKWKFLLNAIITRIKSLNSNEQKSFFNTKIKLPLPIDGTNYPTELNPLQYLILSAINTTNSDILSLYEHCFQNILPFYELYKNTKLKVFNISGNRT